MGSAEEIRARLEALADQEYRAFQLKLTPGVAPERVLGVRIPALRALAKELARAGTGAAFLTALPHATYDENNLHALLLSEERDYDRTVTALDAFLPYVDNWATCDIMSPRAFRKNRPRLREDIRRWMASDRPFTVRFGMEMLMTHFLDGDYSPEYPEWVTVIDSNNYYVNMMIAWYFATALAKQYDSVIPYLEDHRLSSWVHNKTIQKAVESFRVPEERKAYLRTLRLPGNRFLEKRNRAL